MQDDLQKKSAALADKEAIIELVEQEILKIKDSQDNDKRQVQEKEAYIDEISSINDQLQRQNETKGEEIRLLIDKMESYKSQRDQEGLKLRKKLAQAEEDIKVLIVEQERQKKVANEKIKMLGDMFK